MVARKWFTRGSAHSLGTIGACTTKVAVWTPGAGYVEMDARRSLMTLQTECILKKVKLSFLASRKPKMNLKGRSHLPKMQNLGLKEKLFLKQDIVVSKIWITHFKAAVLQLWLSNGGTRTPWDIQRCSKGCTIFSHDSG